MSKQEVILCEGLANSLTHAIEKCPHDKLFILTDEHTHRLCRPHLDGIPALEEAEEIIIGAEDVHKNLETLAAVWQALSEKGASRHSLLINLGGGMVTDLGGFAASTFKRGIAYINVPTTLLAMVDASVGGKTGINFNGLKNEIGVFAPAACVLLETEFLRSLDAHNFFSGYAEMLKHGLISTPEHLAELLAFDTEKIDYAQLKSMVGRSVQVKEHIVEEDPLEHGIRKALNLGHTVGHALRKPRPCRRASGAARLCSGMGTGLRTLPFLYKDRIPEGQDAPDHPIRQRELWQLHLQLQAVRPTVRTDEA